jgi:hypothetical protein
VVVHVAEGRDVVKLLVPDVRRGEEAKSRRPGASRMLLTLLLLVLGKAQAEV